MKKFLVAAISAMSIGAWACPDLSGTYTCDGEELAVETFELNGVNYLEFNANGALPADGKWLDLPDSETEKNAKIRLTCGNKAPYGDSYVLDYEADLYDAGTNVAALDVEIFFHKDGETLKQSVVGKAKGSWGEQPVNEVTVCTKK